ncbi:Abhydrolase domain-containing protein 14A, partial [Stegodyphus mimosarum]
MFSSKTWLDLGTIHILAAMGYRTVAVDLPGYANTPPAEIPDKGNFLHQMIQSFGLCHPVIVSPSMSGYYALPYLLKNWTSMAGYIPVAPVGIEVLEDLPKCSDANCKSHVYAPLQPYLHDPLPDLRPIQTPTMVVFGEKDRSRSSALLSLLPMSQCQEIPNGSHPAYLDNPNLWHQLLYNFLCHLSKTYCLE